MHQWESLRLTAPHAALSPALLDISASHLQVVRIAGFAENAMVGPIYLSAPALERVYLSRTIVKCETASLSGLKYLRLANLSGAGPPLKHILAVLFASPQLKWLDLQYDYPDSDSEATLPVHLGGVVSLPALRGLACNGYALSHIASRIDAPNCHQFDSTISFDNFLRIGATAMKLLNNSTQTDINSVSVTYTGERTSISIYVKPDPKDPVLHALGLPQIGPEITVRDIPYEENWRLVIQSLGLLTERRIYPTKLSLRSGPATFSGEYLSFWSSAAEIRFDRSYPHVHLALHYLSDPVKCPQLTRLSFEHDWVWVPARHATYGTMWDGILECLKGRCAAPPLEGPIGAGAENHAHMTIAGGPWLIKRLQGNVPEGVQLRKLWD